MLKDVSVKEIKSLANLMSFYDSFNALALESGLVKLNDAQVKACNYLGEDSLRFITSLGYLLHIKVKENTNIHKFLENNQNFNGVIIHPPRYDYNEKTVCFAVVNGQIIYTKCSTCLEKRFDAEANIVLVSLYGYNKIALCLNYFYASNYFSKAFFMLLDKLDCLPISFMDVETLCYICVYNISSGRNEKLNVDVENYNVDITFNYEKQLKEVTPLIKKHGILLIFDNYLKESVGVINGNMIDNVNLEADKRYDIIALEFDQKEKAHYIEYMSKEELSQL